MQPATNSFTTSFNSNHEQAVSTDGLEHIFRWASNLVADGEDSRVRTAREKRIRQSVLEVISRYREKQSQVKASEEIAYLQRRAIALLQKMQDLIEENAAVKEIMVGQAHALTRMATLDARLHELKDVEIERDMAVSERRILMQSLASIRNEVDYLEKLLLRTERENARLVVLLNETRSELLEYQERRWWQMVIPEKMKTFARALF